MLFDAYREHSSPACPAMRYDRIVLSFAALDDPVSCHAAHWGVVEAPYLHRRATHIFLVDALDAVGDVAPRSSLFLGLLDV